MRLRDLFEGRDAPLYHGSAPVNAAAILRSDTLEARSMQMLNAPTSFEQTFGVSLTRLLFAAQRFGEVVLELDQRRLAQRHRFIPHNYWRHDPVDRQRQGVYAEAEEYVVGPIETLSRYLTAVRVSPRVIDHMRSGKVFVGDLTPILDHPLLVIDPRLF